MSESLEQKVERLERELANAKRVCRSTTAMMHNMIVANQSAWIEARQGKGIEAGIIWIENGLDGPDNIPNTTLSAQEWYDQNVVDTREQPSH